METTTMTQATCEPRDKSRRPNTKRNTITINTARKFIATQKGK